MMNRLVLVGRLTRDPELKRTGTGTAVTNFTLAVNRIGVQQGQQQADFIPCVVWSKGAENVAKFCSKGSLVGVDGRLQTRSYQNQEGKNVQVIEVLCDSVQFLESKKSQQETQQQTNQQIERELFNRLTAEENARINSFDIRDDEIAF